MRILLPVILVAAGIVLVGCDSNKDADGLVDGQPAVTDVSGPANSTDTSQSDMSDMNSHDVAPTVPEPTDMSDISPAAPSDMNDNSTTPAPSDMNDDNSTTPAPSDMNDDNSTTPAPSDMNDNSTTPAPTDMNDYDPTTPAASDINDADEQANDLSANQDQTQDNQNDTSSKIADALKGKDPAAVATRPDQSPVIESVSSDVIVITETVTSTTAVDDANPLSDMTVNNPANAGV